MTTGIEVRASYNRSLLRARRVAETLISNLYNYFSSKKLARQIKVPAESQEDINRMSAIREVERIAAEYEKTEDYNFLVQPRGEVKCALEQLDIIRDF